MDAGADQSGMKFSNSLIAAVSVCLLALPVLPGSTAVLPEITSYRDIKITPNRDMAGESRGELRADAAEVAELLKIQSLVSTLRKSQKVGAGSEHLSRPMQQARMLCLLKIFIASQEVRKVVATINFDLSRSNEELDQLTSRRNMTANMINTFNFMQGGTLGIIKQSCSFPGTTVPTAARQEIAMTSFGTGTGLAMVNLMLPSLWSRKVDTPPNILAHVFNANYSPADADQSYLWKYMSMPIPGSNLAFSRREILLKHWKDFAGLNSNDKRRERKLAATPAGSEQLRENIRLVSQRMDLLHDMKAHFEEFDAALYELHKAISFD